MLCVLSPAKKLLNFDSPYPGACSKAQFLDEAMVLISLLKEKSVSQISQLMNLSDALSSLNAKRYQSFRGKEAALSCCYPAVLFFQGDVYQGLDAKSLDEMDLEFATQHVRILSGLYGLLKPLDLIEAYRLEMGTALSNPQGKNLYAYWREKITSALNADLKTMEHKELVNLASNEYFKAIDTKALDARLVNIDFKEEKNGAFKTIGIHAKRARGLMARFIIQNRLTQTRQLLAFREANYAFNEGLSNESHLVFCR